MSEGKTYEEVKKEITQTILERIKEEIDGLDLDWYKEFKRRFEECVECDEEYTYDRYLDNYLEQMYGSYEQSTCESYGATNTTPTDTKVVEEFDFITKEDEVDFFGMNIKDYFDLKNKEVNKKNG